MVSHACDSCTDFMYLGADFNICIADKKASIYAVLQDFSAYLLAFLSVEMTGVEPVITPDIYFVFRLRVIFRVISYPAPQT